MNLSIMQPYFFPYIGYFQLINSSDLFISYDDVNYIKQGWVNRNRILLQGKPHFISLNLTDASSFKKINSIELRTDCSKLLKTIKQNYVQTPYFNIVFPIIEQCLITENKNMFQLLFFSLCTINNYLGITTKCIISSEIEKDNTLKGKHKVLSLCHIFKADTYINAIGGRNLYSVDEFKNNNINLKFIKTKFISYPQPKTKEFIAGLSIIDIMMNNSKSDIQKMLTEYELV